MSRLSDAFERLIANHPPGDPDDALAGARRRVETARTRRRTLTWVGAAAAAAVVVVAAATALAPADPADVVRTGPTDTTITSEPVGTTSVDVFFSPADNPTCATTTGFRRTVPADDPPTGAIDALLAGPNASETDQGSTSWFSADTKAMLRSVNVVDGTAFVDFENFASIIPNASTSCGSSILLAQLDATVTQFDGVDRAIYSFDGDAAAFYHWLQMDVPDGARPSPPSGPATDEGYATSGPTGVHLIGPGGIVTEVTSDATDRAYAIGSLFVAYQRGLGVGALGGPTLARRRRGRPHRLGGAHHPCSVDGRRRSAGVDQRARHRRRRPRPGQWERAPQRGGATDLEADRDDIRDRRHRSGNREVGLTHPDSTLAVGPKRSGTTRLQRLVGARRARVLGRLWSAGHDHPRWLHHPARCAHQRHRLPRSLSQA